jgi:Na+/H+ antiporter NhaC
MKKTILNTLICTVFIFLVASVLYYFNGSLEMYPTEEQHEKVRIVTGLFSVLLVILEVSLVSLRIKIAKRSKK